MRTCHTVTLQMICSSVTRLGPCWLWHQLRTVYWQFCGSCSKLVPYLWIHIPNTDPDPHNLKQGKRLDCLKKMHHLHSEPFLWAIICVPIGFYSVNKKYFVHFFQNGRCKFVKRLGSRSKYNEVGSTALVIGIIFTLGDWSCCVVAYLV